jgi:hypothetical protein
MTAVDARAQQADIHQIHEDLGLELEKEDDEHGAGGCWSHDQCNAA